MPERSETILVFGATGQQGGAVVRSLLTDGWKTKAFVRDRSSNAAQGLAALGAELAQGSLDDAGSINAALDGAYGTFVALPSSGQPEYGVTDAQEAGYGIGIADAALAAGVQHLVYSSVAGAGPDTGVGHFESKWRIEEHIRSQGFDSTVVRPTAFMELLLAFGTEIIEGRLTFFMKPEQTCQFIAVEDIGELTARIFADRARFAGERFDIASDAVTGAELAAQIGRVIGQPVIYAQFPPSIGEANPLLGRLLELVDEGSAAGRADLATLRRLYPQLLTLSAWLDKTGGPRFKDLLAQRAGPIVRAGDSQ